MIVQPRHGHVGAVAPVNVEPVQPGVLLARGGKPPRSDVGGDGLRGEDLSLVRSESKYSHFLFKASLETQYQGRWRSFYSKAYDLVLPPMKDGRKQTR